MKFVKSAIKHCQDMQVSGFQRQDKLCVQVLRTKKIKHKQHKYVIRKEIQDSQS